MSWIMDRDWLIATQRLEYEEALRQDIENDIVLEERELERQEKLRLCIEEQLITNAQLQDDKQEQLSPRSMRLQRLAYFENKLQHSQKLHEPQPTEPQPSESKPSEPQPFESKPFELQQKLFTFHDLQNSNIVKDDRCTHFTKLGKRCRLKLFNETACHIHANKRTKN